MGLEVFGELKHKMPNVTGVVIPPNVDGDAVRRDLLSCFGIEIGTSFGELRGKIWRIGTMGYNCRKQNVLICLTALETCLSRCEFHTPLGEAAKAALNVYDGKDD